MPTPGPLELIIILVIALLILGPGKLPDVGAALGKSIREFRKASSDVQDAVKVERRHVAAADAAAPAAAGRPRPRQPHRAAGSPAGRPRRRPAARRRPDAGHRTSRAPPARPWPTPTPCARPACPASR